MRIELVGWDIGGAHLKAVALTDTGAIADVRQYPCPLWLGLERLESALSEAVNELGIDSSCRHAVTMTGELTDHFEDRTTGVQTLIATMLRRFGPEGILVFAGRVGFLRADAVQPRHALDVASANWLASASLIAHRLREPALFVDIGSTTTDLVVLGGGEVRARGYTDYDRLRYDELIYTGVVRTSAMALADELPFEGEWVNLMAEHFATTADIYRLTGELAEHTDQMPAADDGEKSIAGSERRLARLVGRDREDGTAEQWRQLALCLRERQLARITRAIERQFSRNTLPAESPLVGAGAGRFLARVLAARSGRPYVDAIDLLPRPTVTTALPVSDCLPAAAVALLARPFLEKA
ncbi:hydantoinase/oxoprolinase family protein [Methylococcus capsulatus]|jgi:probable H4MPT-linked C1 transfer pathway protein|uniref:(4-(4-[2-(Gamma-L-glutamylamino)ethyl]phenoxymethyl)furan-2-yl)methanamine synthase n=1 Tax=Methylococcus capsulatus TaxID=414 RepID=A0AA35UZU4_METCP|nr:hydantoinase/oxoprolinase family protein [Methylococcus capsulatus]CAI8806869.1 (4-(4-[2-(gamma-L-glutamylamino)ethyl]phenoxymethyl)furan-2-yl)methanamine synthase [Methylococcus capsulatus]